MQRDFDHEMKLDSNTEMDRLLRSFARRVDASNPALQSSQRKDDGADSTSASKTMIEDAEHLDADELNAYAENALPAAACARYMSHLIDCSACRRLATELALAANITNDASANARLQEDMVREKTWHERLAQFFAPPVLRYAAPALALLCVAAIAFVVMRSSRQDLSPMVARNEQAESNSAATVKEQKTESPDQSATTTTTATTNGVTQSAPDKLPGANQSANTTIASPDDESAQASANPTTPASKSASPASPIAETESKNNSVEQQAKIRNENSAAIAPPAVQGRSSTESATSNATTTAASNIAGARRSTTARNVNESSAANAASGEYANRADQSIDRTSSAARAAPPPSNARGRSSSSVARKPSTETSAESRGAVRDRGEAAETRSVAGRQFRREGGAWVDTAYDSSRSLTNVARGSEQFRALVADEPAIRSIANQLGGEVIVVWKGRAYRIR